MGGDGGSIPHRIDMVKTKGHGTGPRTSSMGYSSNSVRRVTEDAVDARENRKTRLTTCALTGDVLIAPVVACRAGFLFNKDAVLAKLLDKKMPEEFDHITSLRDLVDLKNIPGVCPITSRQIHDGKCQAMWPCGCVVSEKGLLTLKRKAEETTCPACSGSVSLVTVLASDSEEFEKQRKVAQEMKTRKKSIARSKDEDKASHPSKRLKESIQEREAVIANYKSKSRTYGTIFHG